MLNIIKEEIVIEDDLKKRIEFICNFLNLEVIITNGNIRKIDKTNLSYAEPHKIIIRDITFLAFNYSKELYVENLSKVIKLSNLESYLKKTI